MGNYAVHANNQYVTYLLDFIKSIENLYLVEDINKEMFDFIVSNEETINALAVENQKINTRLIETVKKLLQQIVYQNDFYHNKWIWNKTTMVFDFKFDSKIVALDVTVSKTKIYGELFLRGGGQTYELLDSLELIRSGKFGKSKRGYNVYEKKVNFYEIKTEEFVPELIEIIEQIRKCPLM